MTGVGLALPQVGPHITAEVIREFIRDAEARGYTSLWVQDHFMRPLNPAVGYVGQPGMSIPDQYGSVLAPTELLAMAAAWSATCLLGSSVLVAGYHWPAQLAARLATIDRMSNGRLVVGLGVGWCAEEYAATGVDISTRGRRMDDFVQALLACWADDPVEHHGPFFEIPPSETVKPLQRPHPSLICGGLSPNALARAAKWFDGWNPAGVGVGLAQRKLAAITDLRDPDLAPIEVWHHIFTRAPGSPGPDRTIDDLVAESAAAARAGFREVIVDASFSAGITCPEDWLRLPGELQPVLDAARA